MNLTEGYQEYSVNINDLPMNFACKYNPNSDEAVLFIHGLACSSNSFRNLFDHDYFPQKSLLLIDLIGFGKSSKPEHFSYSMEDQANSIEELLMKLPPWNIHIAAHSMGGAIALLFKKSFLSRILSFTNIEGNLISDDCGALSRRIASVSYHQYKKDIYQKQLIEFKGHEQLRFEESTPNAIYKSSISLAEWSDNGELLDKFKYLTCRKSYFYGEENANMPVLNKLDFVSKYMISNSGHGMMTENPQEFYLKLAEFIEYKTSEF